MVTYGPLVSPMVFYGPLWYSMVPYGPLRMVQYDCLLSCMVFEILSSSIALLSPKKYHIFADIESFAFLFL